MQFLSKIKSAYLIFVHFFHHGESEADCREHLRSKHESFNIMQESDRSLEYSG
jgi:hypothetical protein